MKYTGKSITKLHLEHTYYQEEHKKAQKVGNKR